MDELTLIHYIIAILAGLASGIVTEIGGAGSLLSLPMLMGLGLPPNVANATNRVGVMTQYTMGYASYATRHTIPYKTAAILSIPLILGTMIGAYVAVLISHTIFMWILMGVMAITIVFNFISPEVLDLLDGTDTPLERSRFVDYIWFFILGLYCGLIQAGMAYLIYLLLVKRLNTHTRTAEAIKTFMSMIVTPFALIIFIWFGHVDWGLGICVAIGGGFGGWLGEIFVEHKDTRTVKEWFMIALVISVVYLLLFLNLHYW